LRKTVRKLSQIVLKLKINSNNPSQEQIAAKTVLISILSNTLLAFIKGIAGVLGNSYALIADAIESLADVVSSFLVLFGIRYANKPADINHPYGHGRAEPLITFIVVGSLITSAIIIALESIKMIQTPHTAPKRWTLYVLLVIVLWKEGSFRYVMKKGKQTNSNSLQADAWHHRSDAVSSIAAFIGISIALFMGKGYESADDWAALVASIFILYNAYSIFRPALGEIMDEHRYPELEERIRTTAINVEGILGTEKCFIRKAGMKYHVDLHALVDGNLSVREGHTLAHELKDFLRKTHFEIGHILIHIEPV
jgi:cation diffusion facilitator family transporter